MLVFITVLCLDFLRKIQLSAMLGALAIKSIMLQRKEVKNSLFYLVLMLMTFCLTCILTCASWVDIKNRAHAMTLFFFVDRFDHFFNFTDQELNALSGEFVDYTCLSDKAILDHIRKDAEVITKNIDDSQNVYYRDDILWAFLSELKLPDSGSPCFKFLSKVARLALVLPHSNASSERIFSLIRKNKTVFLPKSNH